MPEMTIMPLDTLTDLLTEEQQEAADKIRANLITNPGKRFLVRDFPGGTPDLARLREHIGRFVNLSLHQVLTVDRGPAGFEISLGGRHG